jgi:hypothetical protein
MTPPRSMMVMMERHSNLDALFLEHQTAVLDRDLTSARGALEAYALALDAHMSEEETHILPLYRARVPEQPGAQTQMFLDEHARIRLLLADLVKTVDALCPSAERPGAKAVLALLDQETQFKNYMDHHDRRERAFLYPGLDTVTTLEEREALLEKLGIAAE